MYKKLQRLRRFFSLDRELVRAIQRESDVQKMLLGNILARKVRGKVLENIHDSEFRVFSQWGDDGIIQYLVGTIDIPHKTFIEFGVEDYREANTRFLLQHDNWSGLVLDASPANIARIQSEEMYWRHDLTARDAFVDAENINQLIHSSGFSGEIGLLHIDIDGNDYWIWDAITVVSPIIVIVEYNSAFGIDRPITVPYDPHFYRTRSHSSNMYFGASLLALCDLAQEKGYVFVGSNSNGNNAYFVKKSHVGTIPVLTPQAGYMASKFREHRDTQSRLTYTAPAEALADVRGLPVINTRTRAEEAL